MRLAADGRPPGRWPTPVTRKPRRPKPMAQTIFRLGDMAFWPWVGGERGMGARRLRWNRRSPRGPPRQVQGIEEEETLGHRR
jgi:hypothetical protein